VLTRACEPLCPAMIEELVAAFSLHSTLASVSSAQATMVLHCETILVRVRVRVRTRDRGLGVGSGLGQG